MIIGAAVLIAIAGGGGYAWYQHVEAQRITAEKAAAEAALRAEQERQRAEAAVKEAKEKAELARKQEAALRAQQQKERAEIAKKQAQAEAAKKAADAEAARRAAAAQQPKTASQRAGATRPAVQTNDSCAGTQGLRREQCTSCNTHAGLRRTWCEERAKERYCSGKSGTRECP